MRSTGRRTWLGVGIFGTAVLVVLVLAGGLPTSWGPFRSDPTPTWSDEFDGPAGAAPDPHKWGHQTGGTGWGNKELEYYTDRADNAALDGDGHLVITARKATADRSCWYGTCRYTSARLVTQHRFAQAYGRFEARIKLPRGQGIWPAFWMLGKDIEDVGYPQSGEIDVMESLGDDPGTIYGSLHSPDYDVTTKYSPPGQESFADGFHTYAVSWTPDSISFFVDGRQYVTRTRAEVGDSWVFDHPFFLLLNVAVGGEWPGSPDDTTRFPQRMVVDYVRVYHSPDESR
ncbi:MAG: glycoside hydrolase family 16 protein [Streptosporangiaceae bacterium]